MIRFYPSIRTEKGELYKLNTMKGYRSSIQRYMEKVKNIDIINDGEFLTSNQSYVNTLKEIKKAGKGFTLHYAEIEPEDITKLYASIDINTPCGLQEKVWLDIMLYLIRRGRENLRMMNKQTFGVKADATGKIIYTKSIANWTRIMGLMTIIAKLLVKGEYTNFLITLNVQ